MNTVFVFFCIKDYEFEKQKIRAVVERERERDCGKRERDPNIIFRSILTCILIHKCCAGGTPLGLVALNN